MAQKLYQLPEARNKVHLEPFDFSQNRMQTFQPGMIHVLQCIEVNPHEKFRINVSSLTRTIPLNSAAIVRAKEHYNFHFVPTRLLWRYFQDFIIQNSHSDSSSSVVDASVPSVVPTMSMAAYREALNFVKTTPTKDIFGFNLAPTINKLGQELGYGLVDLETSDQPAVSDLLVNILPWCAYQKVYQDFYRNTSWESYDATSFNVDYLNNVGSSLDANKLTLDFNASSATNNLSIFTPRYANYKKDYFFGVRPSSQFGDVSVVSVQTASATPADGSTLSQRLNMTVSVDGTINATGSQNIPLELKGTFDILSLRKAEAIQRLREIQQAGDFRYKGQIDRRFGFSVPDARAQMAEYIGGFDNVLNVTDVTSTASTEDDGNHGAFLGQLAGKGTFVSSGEKTIDYETKEHGYILCTYYISNEVNYNASGIAKQNQHLTFEDYFQPEFQNIGLSTVNTSELIFDMLDVESGLNKAIGYQPRYLEYKVQPDLLLDEFMSGGSFAYWTTPLSHSQQVRPLVDGEVDFRWFKIPPTAFDSIMSMLFSEDLKQNPFLSTMYFDIKALRPMSVDGMPDWHNS